VSSEIGWSCEKSSLATEYWPLQRMAKMCWDYQARLYVSNCILEEYNPTTRYFNKNTDLELDEIPSPPLQIWRECLSSYTKVQNLHFNILLYKKTTEVHNSNKYKTTQRYNGKHFLTSDTKQKVPFRGEKLKPFLWWNPNKN